MLVQQAKWQRQGLYLDPATKCPTSSNQPTFPPADSLWQTTTKQYVVELYIPTELKTTIKYKDSRIYQEQVHLWTVSTSKEHLHKWTPISP